MKLTTAELTARDAHIEALNTAHAAMVEAIRAYNAALAAAATFAETIATERREEWDGRSERWQDSDAGQNAATFVEDWEGFEAEEIEEPENAADCLEALATDSADL
jgi:hypothetical protein